MNPTVGQQVIDAASEQDPASAAAEWMAEFRSDIESFINRPRRGPLPVNWTSLSDEYYSSRSEIFSFDLNARAERFSVRRRNIARRPSTILD
jgi:hypothetical protein